MRRFIVAVLVVACLAAVTQAVAAVEPCTDSNPLCHRAYLPTVRRDATPTPLPTPTPDPRLTAAYVCGLFKGAGLECEDLHFEGYDQFGDYLPRRCGGLWRFLIPSLGVDRGGRLFLCYDDLSGLDAITHHYFTWCMTDTRLCSVLAFNKGRQIMFQVSSDIPDAYGDRYAAIVNGLP